MSNIHESIFEINLELIRQNINFNNAFKTVFDSLFLIGYISNLELYISVITNKYL